MKKVAGSLFAVLFIFMFFFALPVRADIAPPPAPHGGNIAPGETSTFVRMMAETVLIEALPNSSGQAPVGQVSASFQMRNMGEKDEAMMVRFPLNLILGETPCQVVSNFKPVQNFKAWVNDQPASVSIDRRIPDMGYPWTEKTDCWANFPAIFPKGKDVQIRVSYTQEAGPNIYTLKGYVTYPYVIHTGSGWYDTIGSIDIMFRAPWVLDKDTYLDWGVVSERTVVGNEVRWHIDNYNPDEVWETINVTIVNPAVWSDLLRARRDTAANPQDGEAWGRLGKALKEMTLEQRGIYREDYYLESYAAYQKAVELKPWDADWHFGFGELLYNQASHYSLSGKPPTDNFESDSFNQFKAALKINPRHEKTIQFLIYITNNYCTDCISKYGLDHYLKPILTEVAATQAQENIYFETKIAVFFPTNTRTPSPSSTPQPSKTPVPELPTITLSITPSPLGVVESGQPASHSSPQRTPTSHPSGGGICGSIITPLILIVGFWLQRLKTVVA